ncbi:MAG: molecular chaperone DnaJ [Methanomassiliicoccales archaeon]
MAKDYYAVLGVSRDASPDEIKRAYRKLAQQYHPDVAKMDRKVAEEKFKEISEAYEVLMDPEKRRNYDAYGNEGVNFGSSGFDWNNFTHFQDISDLFGSMGFGGSIFDMFFGNQRPRYGYAETGPSLQYDLEINLKEAFEGAKRIIEVPKHISCPACGGTGAENGKLETCPTCRGTGQISQSRSSFGGHFVTVRTCTTCGGRGKVIRDRCKRCGGTGRLNENARIEVQIPRGAEDGMRLRIPGAGEPGLNGGPSGDLYVVLHLTMDERFTREGNDLYYTTEIPFTMAALGGEIEVPTMEATARLQIPAGTQPGTVFRMAGLGMPRLNGRNNGDLFVTVNVRIPKKLTSEQKQLLKRLAELEEEKSHGFFSRLRNA